MPTEERTTKGSERCATHPSRLTVGTCDVCGRPLCIECAVPVKGRVLGPECLSEVLGNDIPASTPPRPWRRLRSPADRVTGALLAVAALATLLPWTRFSTGSGFAGAWAIDVRWSMLAASAAVIGLALWVAFGRRPSVARTVAIVAGTVVVVGSLFAVLNPPPFTKPAIAPWIALFAGAGAAVAGAYAHRRSATPHV
ncbi:MAG: hypothetical protein ACXVEI_10620 [Actinomycetota bacterium]